MYARTKEIGITAELLVELCPRHLSMCLPTSIQLIVFGKQSFDDLLVGNFSELYMTITRDRNPWKRVVYFDDVVGNTSLDIFAILCM